MKLLEEHREEIRQEVKCEPLLPHATLAAIGLKVSSLKLLEAIKQNVNILQKSIRHTPFQKLTDAFIAILAGAHGLAEVNTRVRSDEALQRTFSREAYAEQSIVQETLNACTGLNVQQIEREEAYH